MKSLTLSQQVIELGNLATEISLAAKHRELILTNLVYELNKINVKCSILKCEEPLIDRREYYFDLQFEGVKSRSLFSDEQVSTLHFADLINYLLSDLLLAIKSAKPSLVFNAVELPK